jgi:hypothetical protein
MFEFGGSKVQEQANSLTRGGKVVQDLRMIGGAGYRACFDFENDLIEADEVNEVVAAQGPAFVFHATGPLAFKRDLTLAEFDLESILVEDLEKSRPETAMHLVGGADDGEASWILKGRRAVQHAVNYATGMPSRIAFKLAGFLSQGLGT